MSFEKLEVKLCDNPADMKSAQRLRYQVFCEEMGASLASADASLGVDSDRFDELCDHLLVIDHDRPVEDRVVGNYRLLHHSRLPKGEQFYSAAEYDLTPLLNKQKAQGIHLMELGRSCVHRDYRTNATIQMLWRGIMSYTQEYPVDIMFGCASFSGTNPEEISHGLSYIYHNHLSPVEWRVHALSDRKIEMNRLSSHQIDTKRALHEMPPLIKGYLRLGAWIGDGAVIDHEFQTTDIFITVKVDQIQNRYVKFLDR